MLEELSINNFALIERFSLRFEKGLNILSGETGAGKSILIGALGFLLGGKADPGVIRAGEEETLVSGIVSIDGSAEALAWLSARDISIEDGAVNLRRSLKTNGRGSAYIQSAPVSRTDLAEFTSLLVDMHGQHEHQSLLAPENHRRLVDRFAGIDDRVDAYTKSFVELAQRKKLLEANLSSERERAQTIEFLEFAVSELESAKLKQGEEEALELESTRLGQHEKLFAAVELARCLLVGSDDGSPGALALLRKAKAGLEQAASIDPAISATQGRLDDAYYEMDDLGRTISQYASLMSFSPARMEEVESRLAELHKLKKKHHAATVDELSTILEESREKLEGLKTWEEDRAGLEEDIKNRERELYREALALSEARKKAAVALKSGIETVIRSLGMPKASFRVDIRPKEQDSGRPVLGQFGLDIVEFLISANQGEPEKALAKIASGGELSRVMLAAKTVLAKADAISTLIFDEIDTGIGGEVALSVGEHLGKLGETKQVLCITHLASIAVRADNHMKVEKALESGRTLTRVRRIGKDERVEEIARMLSGDPEESASLAHAAELLKKYGRHN